MIKGLILAATFVAVVLAAVGWQASLGREDAAAAPEEAAGQARQARPESRIEPAAEPSSANAPEAPAAATRTKRLAVENVLQVGGFGCVSCQAVVEGILQESDGVQKAAYEPESDTYLVKANDDFRLDKVARRVRSVSKEYNRRLGLPDSPDWVLEEVGASAEPKKTSKAMAG